MASLSEPEILDALAAIEPPADLALAIEQSGSAAVTVVCEAALGSYAEMRPKVRANAVALVGELNHPQARETLKLLVRDPAEHIAIRAIRGAARRNDLDVLPDLTALLQVRDQAPIIAAELVAALGSYQEAAARSALEAYRDRSVTEAPHRGSAVVESTLRDALAPRD